MHNRESMFSVSEIANMKLRTKKVLLKGKINKYRLLV